MNTSITHPAENSKQFSFWARLSLGRKLQIAFAALFLFTIIITITALWGLNRVQTQYQRTLAEGVEVRRLSQSLDIELLRARRAEKNFQLRWRSEGYDTAYANYIPLFNEAIKQMRTDLKTLQALSFVVATLSSGEVTVDSYLADLTRLETDVDVYETSFLALVEANGKRGYNENTGYKGEFRAAARVIEDVLKDKPGLEAVYITYLELRRNEKDYLARGRQEYVDAVHALLAQLKTQISVSEALSPAQKTELNRQVEAYLTAFNSLVDIDKEIAAHNAQLIAAARDVQPLTIKLLDLGIQLGAETTAQAQTTATQVITASLMVVVIALIASIVLAIFLSQQLTRPVIALTDTAQKISGGNFDAQAEVTSADEIGTLASTFNAMTARLNQAFEEVRRRALTIQTSAEVSRRLSAATSPRQLAVDVVEQLQAAFGYYHAHIYFFDSTGETLVMTGGTGEAGAKMLAAGHSIPRGKGLVGRAAETKSLVLVEDTVQAKDWLPNPLLPETRSELAVPILLGEQVLGVIDVQENVVSGLDKNDVDLLQAIAGQVAISYQNARAIEQSQQQAQYEALVNYIGQRIQRANTVEDALQSAVREIGLALGANRVQAKIDLNEITSSAEAQEN
ncbi:MAG: hypothetical protein OHK0052_19780 [Anaerolineales bacterium]